MALYFGPDRSVLPQIGRDLPAELVLVIDRLLPDAFVLVNFQTGGRYDREVDLVIITRNGVYIVEVKDHRGVITATPNGPWTEVRPDGAQTTIVNRRQGKQESPVLQARNCRQAVEASMIAALSLLSRTEPLHTYPYVLIPYANPLNQIDHTGGLVRVVQGIEPFLCSVVDRECPPMTGPLGYGLSPEQAQSYITRLGLVPYEVTEVAHNGRPAPSFQDDGRPSVGRRPQLVPAALNPAHLHTGAVQAEADQLATRTRARLDASRASASQRASAPQSAGSDRSAAAPAAVAPVDTRPAAPASRLSTWRRLFIRLVSALPLLLIVAGS